MADSQNDEVYGRLVAWIGEQTGHPASTIDAILDAEAKFWAERPRLVDAVLEDEE